MPVRSPRNKHPQPLISANPREGKDYPILEKTPEKISCYYRSIKRIFQNSADKAGITSRKSRERKARLYGSPKRRPKDCESGTTRREREIIIVQVLHRARLHAFYDSQKRNAAADCYTELEFLARERRTDAARVCLACFESTGYNITRLPDFYISRCVAIAQRTRLPLGSCYRARGVSASYFRTSSLVVKANDGGLHDSAAHYSRVECPLSLNPELFGR